MSKLFKGLKKGLEEALAHTEGKITLKAALRLLEIVDKGFYRPRIAKTV